MVDYMLLLKQEPDFKELVSDVVLETLIAENTGIIELIYNMSAAGIEKAQIIQVIKTQMRSQQMGGNK